MANLLEVAEITTRLIWPKPTPSQLTMVIRSSILEYASALWIFSKEEAATEGIFEMPSELLTEVELEVKENEIDVSELNVLRSLGQDKWLQDVGGFDCGGAYIKSSLNQEKALLNDDSLSDSVKPFYVAGNKIKFPKGTFKDKLTITYANMGEGLNPEVIEVNDYVATKVRDKLLQIYGVKMPSDETNNNNPNV